MRNIQSNEVQRIKGYLIRGDSKFAFWYTESFTRDMSENFGQPVADGQRLLKTNSTLDFRTNDQVDVGGELLAVESVNLELGENLNSLRGGASYEKTLVVR